MGLHINIRSEAHSGCSSHALEVSHEVIELLQLRIQRGLQAIDAGTSVAHTLGDRFYYFLADTSRLQGCTSQDSGELHS